MDTLYSVAVMVETLTGTSESESTYFSKLQHSVNRLCSACGLLLRRLNREVSLICERLELFIMQVVRRLSC